MIAINQQISKSWQGFVALWGDWATTWSYILQGLTAVFLALWLAMRLELPQPVVTCMTVVIVMQPQSGQVVVKSLFRLLGTLIGSVVMVTLVALFAQEQVLFLLSAAIWIGMCAAGAMAFRDFRSYAFVLAGYTATLIGLPAVQHPDAAFMMAVWRVLEISLGILCASVISVCLLPQTSSLAMRNAVYRRFGVFTDFVLNTLSGKLEQQHYEQATMRFAAESVGLENLRYVSSFEDPNTRLRSRRLARLNNQFMLLTTRFAALHKLLVRLQNQPDKMAIEGFESCFQVVVSLLEPIRNTPLTAKEAAVLGQSILHAQTDLRMQIRTTRQNLADNLSDVEKMDFDTACELLYRLLDEMHSYCETHASLDQHHHQFEKEKAEFTTKMNPVGALLTGIRTSLIVLLFNLFWIATAWPSGSTFAMVAISISAIVTTAPNPIRAAKQITTGTALAAIIGTGMGLFVLPGIDDFVMLCLMSSPVFVLGFFLSSRPAWVGYGMGLLIFFCFGGIPSNPAHYDPSTLINNYLALIAAQSLIVVLLSILIPPNSSWIWRRLEYEMRMQVVAVIRSGQRDSRSRFESMIRDLLNQAYGFAADSPDALKRLIRWMFIVQNIGHALIELYREQSHLGDSSQLQKSWQREMLLVSNGLVNLFNKPTAHHLLRARYLVEHAIEFISHQPNLNTKHFAESPLRRMQSYLHFIRTTLLDPQSPLTACLANEGAANAS